MSLAETILTSIAAISCILFIAGMLNPVLVLWWLERQNRMMVIKSYGALMVALLILSGLIRTGFFGEQ
jgi:hypothetical protein